MSIAQNISSRNWTCPICYELMDGVNEAGSVSIIKRCHHVFHEACIKNALDLSRRACPTCNLPHLRSVEVIPNPSYGEECRRWQHDPEHFVWDEDKLKPQELIGIPRERQFDIYEYPERIVELNAEAIHIWDTQPHNQETLDKIRRLNQEKQKLKQRFWGQDVLRKIGEIDARFDNLTARFDNLAARFDNLAARFDNLAARFYVVAEDYREIAQDYREMNRQTKEVVRKSRLYLKESRARSRFFSSKISEKARQKREIELQAVLEEQRNLLKPKSATPQDLEIPNKHSSFPIGKIALVALTAFGIYKIFRSEGFRNKITSIWISNR